MTEIRALQKKIVSKLELPKLRDHIGLNLRPGGLSSGVLLYRVCNLQQTTVITGSVEHAEWAL